MGHIIWLLPIDFEAFFDQILSKMKIHISSGFILVLPAESKFRMIEIEGNLKKMNFEHVDLENYNNIAEPSLFRNRPFPIVTEDKKNKEEQTDVQQTILDAEMKTERIIEHTNFSSFRSIQIKSTEKIISGNFTSYIFNFLHLLINCGIFRFVNLNLSDFLILYDSLSCLT